MFPQLNAVDDLITKVKILNALEEWELKENPKENLCTEYQELLQKESEIKSQMAKDNELLERLHAVITDLYVDWERAKRSRRYVSINNCPKINQILSLSRIEYSELSQHLLFHQFLFERTSI